MNVFKIIFIVTALLCSNAFAATALDKRMGALEKAIATLTNRVSTLEGQKVALENKIASLQNADANLVATDNALKAVDANLVATDNNLKATDAGLQAVDATVQTTVTNVVAKVDAVVNEVKTISAAVTVDPVTGNVGVVVADTKPNPNYDPSKDAGAGFLNPQQPISESTIFVSKGFAFTPSVAPRVTVDAVGVTHNVIGSTFLGGTAFSPEYWVDNNGNLLDFNNYFLPDDNGHYPKFVTKLGVYTSGWYYPDRNGVYPTVAQVTSGSSATYIPYENLNPRDFYGHRPNEKGQYPDSHGNYPGSPLYVKGS